MSRFGAGADDPDATTVRPVQPPRRGDEATLPPPTGQGHSAPPASGEDEGDTIPRPREADTARRSVPPAGRGGGDEGTVLQPQRRWVTSDDVGRPTNARPDLYRQPGERPVAPPPRPAASAPPAPRATAYPDPQEHPTAALSEPVRSAHPRSSHSAAEPRTGRARVVRRKQRRAGKGAEKKPATLLGTLGELAVIVALALVLSFLLRTFVAQPFEVPSGSMENTLHVGDKIVAEKVTAVERGDIVVFRDTRGWLDEGAQQQPGAARRFLELIGLAPDSAHEHLVKRVVGMPGDRVRCCDKQGRLSINGLVVDESTYLYSDAAGMDRASKVDFEVVVPAGHVFVLGDHRSASRDARCHLLDQSPLGKGAGGFIPLADVVGTVPAIFFPVGRVRRLETPPIYRAVPAPQQSPPAQPLVVKMPPSC